MNKIDLSLYLVTDNSDNVEKFLNTPFDGGRHIARIEAIPVK